MLVFIVVAADDDDLLDRGELVADAVDLVDELGAYEQDAGTAVVDGVVELIAGEAPVENRMRGADAGSAEGDLDACGVVLV